MKSISVLTQIALLKSELETRERVYPAKIKMGHMSQAQADSILETIRAAIQSLSTFRAPTKEPEILKIEPTLHHIYRCASEHRARCEHCLSIAQLMEDSLGFVRDKKS